MEIGIVQAERSIPETSGIGSERPVILFVSASVATARAFREALGPGPAVCVNVSDLTGARAVIAKNRPKVVVCDTDIEGLGSWRDLLAESRVSPGFAVLVTHSTADEALLLEVVERGGFGVLRQPYSGSDAEWVLTLSQRGAGPH